MSAGLVMDGVPVDVRLDRVSKRYGAATALRDLTLDIPRGAFFSLLGPSGCGKTTTLRLIAGFERPESGTVLIRGRDVTGVPPFRRDFGMVFQGFALFPHLTVAENVAFGLRMAGVRRADRPARVAEALALVRLESFAGRYPKQLSGGQQQRVAIARAVVIRPAVLLLDEPLGALDKNLREEMQGELRALQRTLGLTAVFVTHDQEEALTLSDQVAVMRAGVIEQLGAPRDIYERPRTEFVATFLGASNLLDGEVMGTDGGRCAVGTGLGRIVVAAPGLAPGHRLRLSVRPERLQLGPVTAEGAPAVVRDVVYRGASVHVTVHVPGTGRDAGLTLLCFVPNDAPGAGWAVGDEVRVAPGPDSLVVLGDGPALPASGTA